MQTKKVILIAITILLAVVALFFLYLIYQEKQTVELIENQESILKKENLIKNQESISKKESVAKTLTGEELENQFNTVQAEILEIDKNSLKVDIQKDFNKWIATIRITPETEIIITNLNRESSYLEVGDDITVITKENNITNNLDFEASKIIQIEPVEME